jgi:hypothetical protein
MTEKSEHLIRREHYVSGRQDEREQIIAMLADRRDFYALGAAEHSAPQSLTTTIATYDDIIEQLKEMDQ